MLFLFGIVLCGGMLTAFYFSLDVPRGPLPVPARPDSRQDSFQADADAFNESLNRWTLARWDSDDESTGARFDQSVVDFVEQCVQADRNGEHIPMHEEMFLDAVEASPDGSGSLNWLDRVSIQNGFEDYRPIPNGFDNHYRILAIRPATGLSVASSDTEPRLVSVDLMFYSANNLPESQQWFLVNVDGRWQVYDWQSLDDGRRTSDEYASFISGSEKLSSGFNEIMDRIEGANRLFDDGAEEQAFAKLKSCHRVQTLKEDRSTALLQIAYAWIELDRYDEAVGLLESIHDPDHMWGVWPMLTLGYLDADQDGKALEAAMKSSAQSPNHPRSHWLMSTVLASLGRDDEAADEAVLALRGCPLDMAIIDMVIGNRRKGDLPTLLDAIVANGDDAWMTLADAITYDSVWASNVVAEVSLRESVNESVVAILKANEAWSRRDYDKSAEWFLVARDKSGPGSIHDVAIQDHLDARIESNRYPELFRETDDLPQTLATITQWLFGDDFYGDLQSLSDALQSDAVDLRVEESERASHFRDAIQGYCHHVLDQNPLALPELTRFEVWNRSQSDEQAANVTRALRRVIVETMLEMGQSEAVAEKFPNDIDVQLQIVEYLQREEAATSESFLAKTMGFSDPEIAWTREMLKAFIAFNEVQVEAADNSFREALRIAKTMDTEQDTSLQSTTLRDRARAIVANRVVPSEIQINDGDLAELSRSVIAEASALLDSKTVRAWLPRARSIQDEGHLAAIRDNVAQLRMSTGQFSEAAKELAVAETAIGDVESQPPWIAIQRNLRLQALLECEDFKEASNVVRDRPVVDTGSIKRSLFNAEDSLSDQALIALALRDNEQLVSLLKDVDREEVSSWLTSPTRRRWLVRDVEALRSSIIDTYPLWVTYFVAESEGVLWIPADRPLTIEILTSTFERELGETVEARDIPQPTGKQISTAWSVTSESGQHLLFEVSIPTVRSSALAMRNRDAFQKEAKQLKIAIIDQLPMATRRLFEVAAAFAMDDAIAFRWNDESRIWFGPDVGKRLAWEDRVPVDHDVVAGLIQSKATDEGDDTEKSLADWTAELERAKGTVRVTMTVHVGDIAESVPAELIRVETDDYEMIVKATADSIIQPLVLSGVEYSVSPSNVQAFRQAD
ncbi:hypothetical protein Poly51_57050 [Rubripirellula tenax]|uniref:Tetratricopeptide repeat protein n=1 Tax=Rubripirellula tenax TaxID=2528015 RepID=A0A5C6EGF1_9BACT|nr:tetratricopeptide repeat protein [Rubripirellula tenax]TWU46309.1 hypothetical protein Poly51_57050 [Rubripirellula tenax]